MDILFLLRIVAHWKDITLFKPYSNRAIFLPTFLTIILIPPNIGWFSAYTGFSYSSFYDLCSPANT